MSWLGGQVVRGPDLQSTGHGFRILAAPLPSATQWQVVNTHMLLSPSSIIWLVPANGRWCPAAGELTTDLEESNGSLPPGLWLRSPVGWQLRIGISSGNLCLFWVKDYLYYKCQKYFNVSNKHCHDCWCLSVLWCCWFGNRKGVWCMKKILLQKSNRFWVDLGRRIWKTKKLKKTRKLSL